MKQLSEWGFSLEGLRTGNKGEYWFLAQALLITIFPFLPIYRPTWLEINSSNLLNVSWGVAAVLTLIALVFLAKGLIDLGKHLTPLPYPKEDGELVQTGIYSLVRHPLYSGLIFLTLSWAIFQISLTHLFGVLVILIFLNAKANKEEAWLSEKFPEYAEYQQRVRKLIPWVY
ncbi:isoprenylcysteine carboxylmethyltransferase family protein [Aerosakkonemataceae cyanobacterium BLCC-F154]|uniref:Isoprenylcysteine carboxylmethyltransferase family protein n=1 Tax=Floridaenema fluviatile BLCC-F154 TaxID=3153640 RepID=A0ABV4YDY2_9CYAN